MTTSTTFDTFQKLLAQYNAVVSIIYGVENICVVEDYVVFFVLYLGLTYITTDMELTIIPT
jgi:hypothetical protein